MRFGSPGGFLIAELPEPTAPLQSPSQSHSAARRGRVIAVVNQKGGVGKTTTAVNLAASLAVSEHPTLLVDIDPQANASSAFGVVAAERQLYDALIGDCELSAVTRPTELDHLHLVPSGPDLVGAEIELVQLDDRERRLSRAIRAAAHDYEFVLIDCPPSLGLLTLNALTAADSVLIPLQCEYYALEGLARLLDTVERVRRALNPRLTLEGILFTMVDLRANLTRQVADETRRHFPDRVLDTAIPRNIRLSEAPSHGKPVLLYDLHSKGAISYLRLAEELLKRLGTPSERRPPPHLSTPMEKARRKAEANRETEPN